MMEIVTSGHFLCERLLCEPADITVGQWSGIDSRDRSIAAQHYRKCMAQYG